MGECDCALCYDEARVVWTCDKEGRFTSIAGDSVVNEGPDQQERCTMRPTKQGRMLMRIMLDWGVHIDWKDVDC